MQLKREPKDFIVTEIPSRSFQESGQYNVYKAKKTDLTTHEMVKRIASDTHVSPKSIRYAGTKDRRAITTQYITSKHKLNTHDDAIMLEHVGYTNDHLHLGELRANKFEITAYDVAQTHDVYIPNYFGDQRFSTDNVEIGLQLLKGDFLKVANRLRTEFRSVDELLEKKPHDAVSALRKAPLKILLLYVHSVQSYLYNEVVGEYIKSRTDSYHEVPYRHGTLIFPYQAIPEIQVPLVGAVNELKDFKTYYDPLLKKHDLVQQDFLVRSFPQLTQEGVKRDLLAGVRKKEVSLSDSTAHVSLELESGCYATVVLSGLLS